MSIRMILLVASAVCPLALLAVSCGGSDTGLFGNSGTVSGAQSSSTGGGDTSSGVGQGGSTGSGGNSSASAGGAGGAGGSGGQNTGGSTSSAGGAGGASSSSSSGSGGGPTVPQVYCNNAPCAPGEVCCWNQGMGQDACGAPGSCGMGYAEVACNDIEDCAPGEACCGDYYTTGFPFMTLIYNYVRCMPMCAMGQVIMCAGPHPELCPPGMPACNPSGYLGMGYMVCQ